MARLKAEDDVEHQQKAQLDSSQKVVADPYAQTNSAPPHRVRVTPASGSTVSREC